MQHPRTATSRSLSIFLAILLTCGLAFLFETPRALGQEAVSPVVSGTVTDAMTGLPLQGVVVRDGGSSDAATATTAADGTYSLQLSAGDHTLQAEHAGYVIAKSQPLTLVSGTEVPSIDFALVKYATAAGSVTAEADGVAVASVVVKFYESGSTSPNPAASAVTDASGAWAVDTLAPGDYVVQFDAFGTDYLSRWWEQAATRNEATLVHAEPGDALTLGAQLAVGARISGTTRDKSGNPIPEARVEVGEDVWGTFSTSSDAAGHFNLRGLPAGQYTASASHTGYVPTWFGDVEDRSKAQYFSVPTAANVTNIDITMDVGGAVTGSFAREDPASFGWVTISGLPDTSVASVREHAYVQDDSTSYSVPDLPPGSYTAQFSADGHVTQYFNKVTVKAEASPVEVIRGETTNGIDASLVKSVPIVSPSTLTGHVIDPHDVPIAGATVEDNSTGAMATTDSSGVFTLTTEARDNGALLVDMTGFASEYLGGNFPVDTTEAPTHDLGTLRLLQNTMITGSVTAGPNNVPASGYVQALTFNDNGYPSQRGYGEILPDGTYSIAVPEGYYTLEVQPPEDSPYVPAYYGDAASYPLATFFLAGAGQVASGRDIHLDKAASLSGTIATAEGATAASVTMTGRGFTKTITAGADGAFTFGGLPADSYALSAAATGWRTTWWRDAPTEAAATSISVGAGESLSGYSVVLPRGQSVSGVLKDSSGTALAGREVYLDKEDIRRYATTDQYGAFIFDGVEPGAYALGADGNATGQGQPLWLPGTYDVSRAAILDVASGASVKQDIVLPGNQSVGLSVLAPGGAPVQGCWVRVIAGQTFVLGAETDSSGAAALSLINGDYTLRMGCTGFVAVTQPLTVNGSGSTTVTLDPGASISGTVSGTAAGVVAFAIEVHSGLTYSTTVALGKYSLSGLPAGSYAIGFMPSRSAEYPDACGVTVWSGGSSYLNAARKTVADHAAVTGINAEQIACGASTSGARSVSGRLVLPTGYGVTDQNQWHFDIEVADSRGNRYFPTLSPTDASYTLTGLAPGTYDITATARSLGLGTTSTTVTIVDTDVAGVDLALTVAGSVSGRVLDALGHPMPGVSVNVETADGKYQPSARSDFWGRFTLVGLDAGSYPVRLMPDAPYFQVSLASVAVTYGQVTDLGDLQLELGGRITGTVAAAADPLSGQVFAYDSSGREVATTWFSSGSPFTLSVPAGEVYLEFVGGRIVTQWWKNSTSRESATPIVVEAGKIVTGMDPVLTSRPPVDPGSTVAVTGKVTGPDGPLPNSFMHARDASEQYFEVSYNGADGTYEALLPVNRTYTLVLGACFGVEGRGCPGESFDMRKEVTVGDKPVTGVDFVVSSDTQAKQTVVGKVSSGGVPVAGAKIALFDAATGAGIGSTTTDGSGGYSLGNLAAMSVKVKVSKDGYQAVYQDGSASLSAAKAVSLTAGGTTTVDVALAPAQAKQTVVGKVSSGGVPVAGAKIALFDAATGAGIGSVTTDGSGGYSLGNLAAMSVKVKVSKDGYRTVYQDGSASLSAAKAVSLTAGGTSTVDVALVPAQI